MRTPLRLTAASLAAAALVGTAAGAMAEPIPAPAPAPADAVARGTGSAELGASAAGTAGEFLRTGNVIGLLVLAVTTPFLIVSNGVCDLASGSGLPSPCAVYNP